MQRVQVVIAGAGPVGCVAATYLAQRGIDVVLAEAGADAARDLRASTFHPPTLEMLDEIGITDRLIAKGLKAPVYHWRDRRSGEILSFDLGEIADATRYPFRIQCEQYHLSRMLADGIEAQPSAQMLFGHRLVHFDQDPDGVTVALEGPNEIVTFRADYLIGADGASSIVRKWLGIEFDGFTYPEKFLCLTTDTPLENYLPGLAPVNYVSDPDEWLVLLRVPTLWRVLVPADDADDSIDLLSDAKKDAVFDGLTGDGASVRTFHRTVYRVHQRVAQRFRAGRVFMIGDAAHLNNPLGGFGMNSGIHDAFNLCEKLVGVLAGTADDLLDRFDRQRRRMTHDFIQRQTIDNMAIMRGGQGDAHLRQLEKMRGLAHDPAARREYLLRQAMITSLRDAEAIQ